MGKRVGKGKGGLYPRKRIFRSRAHSNPLNDSLFPVPETPEDVDWAEHYPNFYKEGTEDAKNEKPLVRFLDVGCGFGGLLVRMSPMFPEKLMLGMELREKVTEFVKQRIIALREQNSGQYQNVSCIRSNAMKFLPNYLIKGQLEKLFFLFPDPHFKVSNHRRRIINTCLLTEYAYFLTPGGILYTITDVAELGEWMKSKLDEHPMYERISEEACAQDPVVEILAECSEEGQKVKRAEGKVYLNIYRRIKTD
ncbi:hypothetical protein BSKO_03126 [Bryopsis sp. KO-2023]|nr:hypothetical protein BSKO_03126 [Bryopsis sp. KO-2023]